MRKRYELRCDDETALRMLQAIAAARDVAERFQGFLPYDSKQEALADAIKGACFSFLLSMIDETIVGREANVLTDTIIGAPVS